MVFIQKTGLIFKQKSICENLLIQVNANQNTYRKVTREESDTIIKSPEDLNKFSQNIMYCNTYILYFIKYNKKAAR
ncbi:hypothetical protein DRQ07_09010 [candidate division KSB1 bacterium]|nr:MAG: hypothetical protein DRQ07_09010 [candidate division KSB1 bacterium]